MEELRLLLEAEYGFRIYEVSEQGGRVLLTTETGLYYMYSVPEAYRYKSKLVEKAMKHFGKHNGFEVLPIETTGKGAQYVMFEQELVYVQRAVREVTPGDMPFVMGQTLADFHQASCDFTGDRLFLPYRSLGSWPNMWRKKIHSYEALRDELEEYPVISTFEEYLLTSYTYVTQIGETAVKYLTDCGYHKIAKEIGKTCKLVYQNFDYGLILFNETGKRHLAGQFGWVLDMRTRDIGQWIKADIREHGWNPDTMIQFLDGYNSVCPLLEEEYAIIYALLLYPGRFLRSVDAYRQLPQEARTLVDAMLWQAQMDEGLLMTQDVLRDYPKAILNQYRVCIPQVQWLWRTPTDETIFVRDADSFA